MTEYNEDTPITIELLEKAITVELMRVPANFERVSMYARAIADRRTNED